MAINSAKHKLSPVSAGAVFLSNLVAFLGSGAIAAGALWLIELIEAGSTSGVIFVAAGLLVVAIVLFSFMLTGAEARKIRYTGVIELEKKSEKFQPQAPVAIFRAGPSAKAFHEALLELDAEDFKEGDTVIAAIGFSGYDDSYALKIIHTCGKNCEKPLLHLRGFKPEVDGELPWEDSKPD